MKFPWHWIIEKRGKYLKGQSYATGLGTKCRWTKDKAAAQRFDDEATAHTIAFQTRGRVAQVDGFANPENETPQGAL